ncbi:hypothetical protein NECID01_0778 [Nematocida sp. AWRm77]|nr:hypothetical protein NECID01_0778 [Nematocida sp. AWRm77]
MLCATGIFYNKRAYAPGELVSGYITLQTSGVFAIESIVLTIDKESGIKIEETGQKLVSNEKAVRHLGKFIIYSEKSRKIFPGVHKFPFSFRMMPGEGSTIDYKKITSLQKISVLNKYVSRCEVRIYGIFKPVSVATKEITLVEESTESAYKRTYSHTTGGGCFCFKTPTTNVILELDSILYAGSKHEIVLSASNSRAVHNVSVELCMLIETYCENTSPIKIIYPCKTVQENGRFFIFVEDALPSKTENNDFFSISYHISVSLSVQGSGTTHFTKEISVRGKRTYGSYTPPEILDSAIYPEKYLSLQC